MCKEDVRIKRKSEVQSVRSVGAAFPGGLLFAADPDRISVMATLGADAFMGVGDVVIIGVRTMAGVVPLMALTSALPTLALTLEEIGQLITYELWAWSGGADLPTAWVHAVRFTESLRDL